MVKNALLLDTRFSQNVMRVHIVASGRPPPPEHPAALRSPPDPHNRPPLSLHARSRNYDMHSRSKPSPHHTCGSATKHHSNALQKIRIIRRFCRERTPKSRARPGFHPKTTGKTPLIVTVDDTQKTSILSMFHGIFPSLRTRCSNIFSIFDNFSCAGPDNGVLLLRHLRRVLDRHCSSLFPHRRSERQPSMKISS